MNTTPTQNAFDFLFNNGFDHQEWTRQDYLAASNEEWEKYHDMIQWLFPTEQASAFNSHAPCVPRHAWENALVTYPESTHILVENMDRFLVFLGLEWSPDRTRIQFNGDVHQLINWLECPTHNDLRITRVLDHLISTGLKKEALALFDCVSTYVKKSRALESTLTLEYWSAVVNGEPPPSRNTAPTDTQPGSWLLHKLKGNQSLDDALDVRLQQIANIGKRRPFKLRTVHDNGFNQTELYPDR